MYWRIPSPLLALVTMLCALLSPMQGQSDNPQDSVADAARKTQAEKSAKGHVSAKKVLDDDSTPKTNMVRRVQEYWATIPPSKLTVLVPISSRPADHGVEVPVGNSEVYVPFAETSWTPDLNKAAQHFFEMISTRSRFSGLTLKLGTREESSVSGQPTILVHVNFMFHSVGHDGIAIFISVPEQIVGLGCIYRSVDWEKAQPICEEIVNSAEVSVPSDYKLFKRPID